MTSAHNAEGKHISEQIADLLRADDWAFNGSNEFSKLIDGWEEPGEMSPTGRRMVALTICERGRYLSRVDGWRKVEKDADLRNFLECPEMAIAYVMARG